MPKDNTPGKPTTRRYTEEEKAQAVRLVRQLRQASWCALIATARSTSDASELRANAPATRPTSEPSGANTRTIGTDRT